MCCSWITPLNDSLEPLFFLTSGNTVQSNVFLQNISKYNSRFQIMPFGPKEIQKNGFMPSFKVQEQIYIYHPRFLSPLPDHDAQFLVIHFLGDTDFKTNRQK